MWQSPTSLEQESVKSVSIKWSLHMMTTNRSQRCLPLSRGKIILPMLTTSVGTKRRKITLLIALNRRLALHAHKWHLVRVLISDNVTFYMYIYFDINIHTVRVWRWRYDLVYIYIFGYTYTYSARLTLITRLFIHVHNLIYVYIYWSQRQLTPSRWALADTDTSKR